MSTSDLIMVNGLYLYVATAALQQLCVFKKKKEDNY